MRMRVIRECNANSETIFVINHFTNILLTDLYHVWQNLQTIQ